MKILKKQRGVGKEYLFKSEKKMIDLSYENVSEFKKPEITRLIKKSISVGIKEMHFEKNFYISVFVTNNINMKKLILNTEGKIKQQMFCLFLKMKQNLLGILL